jgi:hypothetical protein
VETGSWKFGGFWAGACGNGPRRRWGDHAVEGSIRVDPDRDSDPDPDELGMGYQSSS